MNVKTCDHGKPLCQHGICAARCDRCVIEIGDEIDAWWSGMAAAGCEVARRRQVEPAA